MNALNNDEYNAARQALDRLEKVCDQLVRVEGELRRADLATTADRIRGHRINLQSEANRLARGLEYA